MNTKTLLDTIACGESSRIQLIYADEVPVPHSSITDIELTLLRSYYQNRYEETLEESGLPLPRLLENLNLFRNGQLTLTGLLLFGKSPQILKPAFIVKAVVWPGNDVDVENYVDSQDISGVLSTVFEQTLSFISRNLRRIQQGQSVNSLGKLEIPKIVIEEMLVNALLHRDYFISAPIKIFMFDNRIEIISPGGLPNNLTIANIRHGISNMRNPLLASHAIHLLPYRGLGAGIRRAHKAWQTIDFVNYKDGNQFQVIISRQ